MNTTKIWLTAACAVAVLAAAACKRAEPAVSPASDAPVAARSAATEPASTEAHDEVASASAAPSADPVSAQAANVSSGGGTGGCTTTYIGGGFQPGFNGSPSIYTPPRPMTVCSHPPIARAMVPVAAQPLRAAPVAAPAVRAEPPTPAVAQN